MSDAHLSPAALGERLERRFRTTVTPVRLGDRTVEILHPVNADDLISEADYVKDERLPYWADLWPSSLVLARLLAARGGEGRSLLELGCGSGLAAVGAALAGYRVTATDYYEDATLFARVNVWRNTGIDPTVRLVDWTALPDDLRGFDLVVASDVLYEPRYPPLVAAAIAHTLAPQGVAIIADPGRVNAPAFPFACREHGLHADIAEQVSFEEGKVRQRIDVWYVKR